MGSLRHFYWPLKRVDELGTSAEPRCSGTCAPRPRRPPPGPLPNALALGFAWRLNRHPSITASSCLCSFIDMCSWGGGSPASGGNMRDESDALRSSSGAPVCKGEADLPPYSDWSQSRRLKQTCVGEGDPLTAVDCAYTQVELHPPSTLAKCISLRLIRVPGCIRLSVPSQPIQLWLFQYENCEVSLASEVSRMHRFYRMHHFKRESEGRPTEIESFGPHVWGMEVRYYREGAKAPSQDVALHID
jgi:hypothetical protein